MARFQFEQTGAEIQTMFTNISEIQRDTSHTTIFTSNSLAKWILYYIDHQGGKIDHIALKEKDARPIDLDIDENKRVTIDLSNKANLTDLGDQVVYSYDNETLILTKKS